MSDISGLNHELLNGMQQCQSPKPQSVEDILNTKYENLHLGIQYYLTAAEFETVCERLTPQ